MLGVRVLPDTAPCMTSCSGEGNGGDIDVGGGGWMAGGGLVCGVCGGGR